MKNINQISAISIITIVSVLSSLVITYGIAEIFGTGVDVINITSAIVAPAIIAPLATWYIVSLLVKINKLEKEQRTLATYDTLTGLFSRRAFLERIDHIFKGRGRTKNAILAYLDLDNFKLINEQYGHAGGDAVLKNFGAAIQHTVGKSGISGRLGGEEFAIVLPNASKKEAYQILENLQLSMREAVVTFADQPIIYTVSIGVSIYHHDDPIDWETLIIQADHALYNAKNNGKNRIELYQKINEEGGCEA